MFHTTQIKLTILYSALFLTIFYLFSAGIYLWMDKSFGMNYVNLLKETQRSPSEVGINNLSDEAVTNAAREGINNLLDVILFFDLVLLFVIPATSWFLAESTFRPIQKAHERQKQFVSDASHEMRTPLTIMSGELEVALSKDRKNEDYKKILISSKEEVDQLSQLVENLLFLAREDQSKNEISFSDVDVTDIIISVISGLKNQIRVKEIDLEFTPPERDLVVKGNATMLKQLFYNLIENGIKYTHEKGRLTISFAFEMDSVYIYIADTGIGISEKSLQNIFNRFYRVEQSRSKVKGYGLGLAISKSIVEQHHGFLSCVSTLGKGSTFILELPA